MSADFVVDGDVYEDNGFGRSRRTAMTRGLIYIFTECAFIQDFDAAQRLWDTCKSTRYLRPHSAAEFPMICRYSARQWMDGGFTCMINLDGLISLVREGFEIRVVDSVVRARAFLVELETGSQKAGGE